MNFCPNCGNKVNSQDNFCSNCGTKLQVEVHNPQEELGATQVYDVNDLQALGIDKQQDIRINHQVNKRSWITSVKTFLTQISYVIKYLRASRKRRLYKQWVETANLPPDAIQEELPEDAQHEAAWKKFKLFLLYILLGAAAILLFAGLVLLILRSC
jgi:hypothetical protein